MEYLENGASPSGRVSPWALGLTAVIALVLAGWRFWCAQMYADYAVCGLLGLAMLEGEFPLFFYGQDFMGSLDGLLAAPIYLIFGPSSLALHFWPPVLWLGIILVTWRMLARLFSPLGAWAGSFLLALPPAMLLCWAGQAQTHYPLALFLAALLMYLTLRLWQAPAWGPGLPFAWGLVAGLAVWTNFQAAVVVLPCGLFLLFFCLRRVLGWPLLAAALGLALGAGPLIYYNLTYGFPHGGQGEAFAWALVAGRLKPLFYNALPLLLGFGGFWNHVKAAPAPDWSQFAVYLLVLAALALAVLGVALRGLTRERRFLWLPLMVALANGAVLVFSAYGRLLGNNDQRYFLPVYLCLPFLWAWLAEGLGRRRTLWGILPMLALAGIHVWLYPDNPYCGGDLRCREGGYHLRQEPALKAFAAGMRARGWHAAYTGSGLVMSFASGDAPVFVHPWDERRARAATAVDASLSPVFVLDLAGAARLLGSPHQVCPEKHCGYVIHHSFQEPVQANRLLDLAGARAHDLLGNDLGGQLGDGDLGTGFAVDGPRADRAGVVLDLGREEMVAGIGLLPQNELEHPGGLLVEAAGEDGIFATLGQGEGLGAETLYWSGPHPFLKLRFGRTEAYFPPRPARYLRLTHLGAKRGAWSLGELLVYGAEPAAAPPSWAETADRLLADLKPLAPRRVFADAWPAAVIARGLGPAWEVVIANQGQNDFGHGAKSVPLVLPLSPRPGDLLVVTGREAARAQELLDEAGFPALRREAGRLAILEVGARRVERELPMAAVGSDRDSGAAAELARGVPAAGRWGSQAPRRRGSS